MQGCSITTFSVFSSIRSRRIPRNSHPLLLLRNSQPHLLFHHYQVKLIAEMTWPPSQASSPSPSCPSRSLFCFNSNESNFDIYYNRIVICVDSSLTFGMAGFGKVLAGAETPRHRVSWWRHPTFLPFLQTRPHPNSFSGD